MSKIFNRMTVGMFGMLPKYIRKINAKLSRSEIFGSIRNYLINWKTVKKNSPKR